MTYGLNDICLVPARTSRIEHRADCSPYNFDGMLPLFTAPMNSVINENNYEVFLRNKINTIIPRGVDYDKRWELSTRTFVALGLSEFEKFIIDFENIYDTTSDIRYVCIDIANGHMLKLIDLCSRAKSMFGGRLSLMAGNIANPDTYTDYSLAGIDFVRIGIGGGSVCTTSANGGIHYAMASLIKEVADKKWAIEKCIEETKVVNITGDSGFYLGCNSITHPYKSVPFIIADGGFDNYDKIIKALALGADYVMVGKLFAQSQEACGELLPITDSNLKFRRKYYGMSTKKAQMETGNQELKTAEGIETVVPVLYKLQDWCENFVDYLRSMMSYSDSFDLLEFKKTKYRIVSPLEYLSFYK